MIHLLAIYDPFIAQSFIAQYRPFIDPLPIYNYWYWLLLPLCLLFSIVYKAVKCESIHQVPKAALAITLWILLGMAAAGAVLAGLDWVLS